MYPPRCENSLLLRDPHLLSLSGQLQLCSPLPLPRPLTTFFHSRERRALFRQRRGASVCLEGLSPPPPRVSVLLGILAWVGCWGAQIAATNWLAARGRLFKSAGSTGARSLFGNFCRGKRARKELQSGVGFFLFFFPSSLLPSPLFAPFFGLHAEPANFEKVLAGWEKRGVRRFGVFSFLFFFF